MTSYTLPHLPWLRAFEAAARHRNFSAAAQELHLSPAAISLQIRSLEEHLGYALFERLPRGVRLTDMGGAYLPAVRKAFDTLSMSTAGLFGHAGRRALTVRCTAAFAVLWLAPRLPAFLQAHPAIDVRLFTAIWADGLGDGQADVDIRFGDGRWSGFEVQRLHSEPSVPVCSPPGWRGRRRRCRCWRWPGPTRSISWAARTCGRAGCRPRATRRRPPPACRSTPR
ncbi:MAG: LysR family transcriptional regulator [Rhodoferax sp.]